MRKILIPVIILIVVGFFVYSFNLNNGLFWDDDDWIVNNVSVHNLSWTNIKFWFSHDILAGIGLKSNYYRPFLFFTFAFNYIFGGIKPLGYHLLSNLLHIANAVLIFSLFFQIFRRKILAFLTALIFLIHPLQTEAVTYIAGRGDPLNVFFMLLALFLFYLSEKRNLLWKSWQRLASVGFLILALLSRETAIMFPFLLMVFYISFLSPKESLYDLTGQAKSRFLVSLKNSFMKALPYFGVVFIYGILRLTILNFSNILNFYSTSNVYSENLHVRMFTFLETLFVYLKLLIVPIGLHMERSAQIHLSFFEWPVWLSFLGLVGLLALLVVLYKRDKPDFRIWFFGLGWFFVALGPVSGITPINALVYEHWLYLPMIGFFFIAAFYLDKLFNFLKTRGKALAYWLLVGGLIVYLSFFGFQAIKRNILWGNPTAFYKDILGYEPSSVRINNNLGNLYYNEGDIDAAEEYYKRAVESEDIFAQPHFNIGSILQLRGDIEGAIIEYKKAIEVDPNFYYSYQNLIVIYANQGDFVRATEYVEKLKIILPTSPRAYYNAALIYLARNNTELAIMNLQQGLRYTEFDPETREAILGLLESLGFGE